MWAPPLTWFKLCECKPHLSDNYTAAVFVYYNTGNSKIVDVRETKPVQDVLQE